MADEFDQYVVKTSPNKLGGDEFEQYKVKASPPSNGAPSNDSWRGKGFFARSWRDLNKRADEVFYGPSMPADAMGVHILGQATGGLMDVGLEGVKSTYKTVVPKQVQEDIVNPEGLIVQFGKKIAQSPIGQAGLSAARQGEKYWLVFKKTHPDAARMIEDVLNIASLFPGEKALSAGKDITKATVVPVAKEGGAIISDLARIATTKNEQEVEAIINKGVTKSVLSGRGIETDKEMQKLIQSGNESTKDIIKNYDNLSYIDIDKNVTKGHAPRDLGEWRQAIAQRKVAIWQQVKDINKAAGQQGFRIPLDGVINDLEKFAAEPAHIAENPEAVKYAKEKIKVYKKLKSFSIDDAQDALVALNANFEEWVKTGSTKKLVDVISGNYIRNMLDTTMEKLSGNKDYEALKKAYGAHTNIESYVTKKSLQEAAKIKKPQWLDVLAGAEFIGGLWTAQPKALSRAISLEALNQWRNAFKTPNKFVKGMFEEADKAANRQKLIKSRMLKSVMGKPEEEK